MNISDRAYEDERGQPGLGGGEGLRASEQDSDALRYTLRISVYLHLVIAVVLFIWYASGDARFSIFTFSK